MGDAETFDVHPENSEVLGWFLSLSRRWLISEMGGVYLRLDDAAIAAQMSMRGIGRKKRIELLDSLMLMEAAALEILNKK